jgi:hypothetical protein
MKPLLLALVLTQMVIIGGPPKVQPLIPTPDAPPTYYVRTDGSNSNDGLTNSAGGAFLTMDFALDNASPGDVIRVQAGTYAARLSPAVSGEAGNTITLVADGVVTFCGADVSSKNYIRIIGFIVDTDAGGCTKATRAFAMSGTNTGWEFWHNTIRDAHGTGIGGGAYSDRQHNTIVIGNVFTAIGGGGNNGSAISLRGNHNFHAYNELDGLNPDHFIVDGTYSYWLNNYIHGVLDTADLHSDIVQAGSSSLGLQFNLFEANVAIGNGTLDNEHGVLMQNQSDISCSTGTCAAMTENLFRRNVWHNRSGGEHSADQVQVAAITETRLVHETVVLPMRTAASNAYGVVFNGAGITARVHNSLFYQAWGDSISTNVQVYFIGGAGAAISSADYNLAYDPDGSVTFTTPWTSQASELSNVDPSLTNVAGDDFTIGSGSGARNAAGALTVTSGSGTGTTFNVAAGGGGFFRGPNTNLTAYGGGLTAGDVITVGTDVLTIASISTDAITVTESFTWADADPVYLGNDTTPDIGALPYRAGGYTMTATYAVSGNVATVTPNDASLVRFIVCYDDNRPVAVDRAAPYTCNPVSGTLSIRVFPIFPSTTLWAVATEGN